MSYDVAVPAERLHALDGLTAGWDAYITVSLLIQPDKTVISNLDKVPSPGSTVALNLTVAQIGIIADWAEAGETMCAVELTAEQNGTVTAAQGDDTMTVTAEGAVLDTGTPADPATRIARKITESVVERNYLLDRMKTAARPHASRTIGASSQSMVINAIDPDWPLVYPVDSDDLNRCERTFEQAPQHLKPRMRKTLDTFRQRVQ